MIREYTLAVSCTDLSDSRVAVSLLMGPYKTPLLTREYEAKNHEDAAAKLFHELFFEEV